MNTLEASVHWLAEPTVAIWWTSIGAFWMGWALREITPVRRING